jgi:hypothetical protein
MPAVSDYLHTQLAHTVVLLFTVRLLLVRCNNPRTPILTKQQVVDVASLPFGEAMARLASAKPDRFKTAAASAAAAVPSSGHQQLKLTEPHAPVLSTSTRALMHSKVSTSAYCAAVYAQSTYSQLFASCCQRAVAVRCCNSYTE